MYADDVDDNRTDTSRKMGDIIMCRAMDEWKHDDESSNDEQTEEADYPTSNMPIQKEESNRPLLQFTKNDVSDLTRDIISATTSNAREIVATNLEKKGSSEYEAYRDLLDVITDEIFQSREIFQLIPTKKRLCLLVDCSSSMQKLDSVDFRLGRCMEIAALIMETCWGMEKKWDYSILGHNGESSSITFVPYGEAPINGRDRFRVLQKMIAQTQFCQGGDNTLNAIVDVATSGKSDLVIVISDAYLEEHNVDAESILQTLRHCRTSTKIYFIFIAGFVSEAIDIIDRLPKDRGYACRDSKDIPFILQLILENFEPTFPRQEGVREKIVDLSELRKKAAKNLLK
jgi:hypothetical protein